MRTLFATLILIALSSGSFANDAQPTEKAETAKINFQEPPYWMFSYDEFQGLRDEQKKTYLEGFLKLAKKLPATSTLTKKDLDEAGVWDESWENLMTKVYRDCATKEAQALCDDIAEVRMDVLRAYGNKKLENRAAAEATESKTSKSKPH